MPNLSAGSQALARDHAGSAQAVAVFPVAPHCEARHGLKRDPIRGLCVFEVIHKRGGRARANMYKGKRPTEFPRPWSRRDTTRLIPRKVVGTILWNTRWELSTPARPDCHASNSHRLRVSGVSLLRCNSRPDLRHKRSRLLTGLTTKQAQQVLMVAPKHEHFPTAKTDFLSKHSLLAIGAGRRVEAPTSPCQDYGSNRARH